MTGRGIPYFNFYPADFMHGVRGLTPTEVGIYIMLLCRMYEENGPIDCHKRRLAAYCGCRENTLTQAVEKLIDLGKIVLSEGLLSNTRAMAEIESRKHVVKIASEAGKSSAKKRQQNQGQAATTVQRPFNHTDTDKERKKEIGASAPFDHLIRVVSEDVARAFIDHRKNKKAPLTAQAAKLIADKLAGRRDADDLVNTSIMNGWTGVFTDKPEVRQKQDAGDFWTGPRLG